MSALAEITVETHSRSLLNCNNMINPTFSVSRKNGFEALTRNLLFARLSVFADAIFKHLEAAF